MWTGSPVDLDLAGVEAVHAADALDERRLSGAVVAEQREHLAVVHLEVHRVERQHRAEALRRATHSQGGRSCQRRLEHPEALLEPSAHHVGLDGQRR